jgi:hypothetical protein
MALRQRSVLLVACPLSGARSGQRIGKMLSTAVKSVVANEADNLCQF